MSELQEIDIYIKPDGTVRVEVRGVKGGKCLELTEFLERMLGGDILERLYTDEFNEDLQQPDSSIQGMEQL
jgi:hypothetical protein